jgi:hypothetical protein
VKQSVTDGIFSLTTGVPSGTETASALTSSRSVSDVAGNIATAGPIGGNLVDKKAPTITISAPTAGVYLLKQVVAASYACSDGGSGVAQCAGPLPNGSNIDTTSAGNRTFTVSALDNVGNAASPRSVNYQVSYAIPSACVLYDQTKAVQSGSVAPIKFQLCDANGTDVSASTIIVKAQSVTQISSAITGQVVAVGNANPDNDFRFDASVGSGGGYIYNLSTKGLSTGTYVLAFTVAGDPVSHQLQFQIK